MVLESEIVDRLYELLRTSDLNTTTTTTLRRQLEQDLGVDLSGRKAFIREKVDLFLRSEFHEDGEEEIDGGDQKGEVKSEGSEGSGLKEEGQEEEEDDDVEEEINGKVSGRKRRLISYSSSSFSASSFLHFLEIFGNCLIFK